MKKEIQVMGHAQTILKALQTGVLLTTKTQDKVNTMTISWGTLGIEWGKPIFTTFVRQNRYTHKQLMENPYFTINVPVGNFDRKILGMAGTLSGYNEDKIQKLGLHLIDSDTIDVPGIQELPLTLECKIIYAQKQVLSQIDASFQKQYYPQDVDSTFHGSNKDVHTAFYGEILKATLLED